MAAVMNLPSAGKVSAAASNHAPSSQVDDSAAESFSSTLETQYERVTAKQENNHPSSRSTTGASGPDANEHQPLSNSNKVEETESAATEEGLIGHYAALPSGNALPQEAISRLQFIMERQADAAMQDGTLNTKQSIAGLVNANNQASAESAVTETSTSVSASVLNARQSM
ncbi:MAG: hypothetical protein HUJ30_02255 [Gammaproteobacteria bacterium]|nr:hypothetical protein [Gammaproteobacteria bacterium]